MSRTVMKPEVITTKLKGKTLADADRFHMNLGVFYKVQRDGIFSLAHSCGEHWFVLETRGYIELIDERVYRKYKIIKVLTDISFDFEEL